MAQNNLSIYSRVSTRINWNYRYLIRARGKTIYHCCIQKTGSQWFKKLFNDEIFWNNSKLINYSPKDNFITDNEKILNKLDKLPINALIGPLYIRRSNFENLIKPKIYKAFFIARDPRDLIISNYFSLKYSHSPYDPYILKMRDKLNNISQDDGIFDLIESLTPGIKMTLEGWFKNNSENIYLLKFEDLFGLNHKKVFAELLQFCEINLSSSATETLLDKYSFQKISGRKLGTEDVKNHYRKGIPGDWKNYFNEEHTSLFKELSGDLLINCNYEKDNNW